MAPKDFFRNSQLSSNQTHFVFEQLTQRLDQLEIHLLRQSTNVVVTLDHSRWATHGNRLDDVWVERSLHQVTNITAQTLCFFLKHIDEYFTDAFALLFRIGNALERFEEQVTRTNTGDIQLHTLSQQRQS